MSTSKLLGLVLLVGGILCVVISSQWSDSAGDQVKHFFTGDYRDKTVWLALAGILSGVIGLVALFTGKSRG